MSELISNLVEKVADKRPLVGHTSLGEVGQGGTCCAAPIDTPHPAASTIPPGQPTYPIDLNFREFDLPLCFECTLRPNRILLLS